MAAILALLAALSWGSSDYAAGSASRRSSAVSVVILTHLTALVVLLAVAVDIGPAWSTLVEFASPDRTGPVDWQGPRLSGTPTPTDLAWGIAAGLGGGFGAMLLFRGLGRGSMAVVAPITAAGAASVPVVLGVATGESLAASSIAGILLALVAIVLVSLSGSAPVDRTDGAELTVPEEWTEQYRNVVDASAGGQPLPSPDASGLVTRAPSPTGAVVTAPIVSQHRAMPVAEVAANIDSVLTGVSDLRTLRLVTAAMMTLLAALIVTAGGIAAGPIAELASGSDLTIAHVAMLVFALAAMAIATAGLRVTRPLLATASGFTTVADPVVPAANPPIWRRVLKQPGLPEALLSGLGFGMFYVCIYRAGASAGHWPLVSARGVSVVMFTAGALVARTATLPVRGSRRGVVIAGVFDATAAILFVLATQAGLLSIGAVLASLYPAVTVVLARTVGGEHISRRQVAGLGLALGAVVLLAV